ncbi:MAG: helix-turn-helix transcriptional regulator [Sphingobacteriales bacterium]|nr:helix-turn-helix transcriptional regulator [Sphingobacteriales bacterium]
MKPVGEKIKKIRELKGLTQEYIAEKLNVSPQAYGKIERNETRLDVERLQQIAKILEVSTEFISNFDERQIFINSQYNGGYKGTFTQNYNEATQQLIEHLENSLKKKRRNTVFTTTVSGIVARKKLKF